MIHVCYGLHDGDGRYSKFVGTSLESLLENTRSEVTIHLIHDDTLSQENRARFESMCQSIEFHDISGAPLESLRRAIDPKILARFSIGAIFRIFIPYIIDTPRAIYLDADTIVNLDISEVWSLDLGRFAIAAPCCNLVSEYLEDQSRKFFLFEEGLVDYRDYFGSNLLLMDLSALREIFPISSEQTDLISLCTKYFTRYPESNCADQDFLNYIFSRDYLKIPEEMSRAVLLDRESQIVPWGILQFSSHTLGIDTRDPFNRLWFEYFLKTPFATLALFANLFDEMVQQIAKSVTKVRRGESVDLKELNYDFIRKL